MRLFNRFQLLLANAPNVQTGSQLARDTPGHHGRACGVTSWLLSSIQRAIAVPELCDWQESCRAPGLACHAFKVYASTGAYAPADRGLEPLPDDQYPE